MLFLTLRIQQILVVLVIIPKRKIRLTKKALIIIARAVPVIIAKIIIIERILVASEHKENSKNGYYRLYL